MQIQDIKIEEYLELVEAVLARLGEHATKHKVYFFICHAFYSDFEAPLHALTSPSFRDISPSRLEGIIQDLLILPFGISAAGDGFGNFEEWSNLRAEKPEAIADQRIQALHNTRRAIFLLCLRKEILDQIQQGNEVFDIEQIYKRLKD